MERWIKNNTVVKILAIAVSILLWGMVHIEDDTTTPTSSMDSTIIENVKVQHYGLDESLYVLNAIDTERVRIEVEGKRSAITSIFNDDYKVMLDLTEMKEGTFTVPLSYELPSGVQLVSMSPSKVTVTIEKQTQASFPVTIVTTGSVADNYVMGEPIIEPNQVKVTLPDSELDGVIKVQGKIKLEGSTETISDKKVTLIALDSNGQQVKDALIEPSEVSVQIPIIPPSKIVPLNIQYSGSLPDGLVLSSTQPSVNKVTVYGPMDTLSKIESYDAATVDLSQIDAVGSFTLDVELVLPTGVVKIEPNPIQVVFEVVAVGEVTLDNIPVEIEGVSEDTVVTVVKPEGKMVSLTLSGAYTLLNNLEISDIHVSINAENLKPGVQEVPLIVSLPQFITLGSEQVMTATIEVTDKNATPTINDTVLPNDDDIEPVEEGEMGEMVDPTDPVKDSIDEVESSETQTGTDIDKADPNTETIP
ncbi:CdaR family protein [Paenibacillus crassostreae]|uniref:YbbR-like domain-containing protein YbbR n=1 Tax=Paenibacillus crassostreae TaxID=1763538 RepID=A0A167EWI1_9BACL|nr:CdaR family protein [Paenibacillus crassostreae]OAB75946.1 hypothetical protein PNBC_07900 [Paenibacillus crassostreae]